MRGREIVGEWGMSGNRGRKSRGNRGIVVGEIGRNQGSVGEPRGNVVRGSRRNEGKFGKGNQGK